MPIFAKGVTEADLRKLAQAFDAPAWATHIAVRFDGMKVEPTCWVPSAATFYDEDPSLKKYGDFVGSFKTAYWHIFPVLRVV